MLPFQVSRTLLRPAVMRAAHQILDRPIVFEDPMAVGLVPDASESAIMGAVDYHRTELAVQLRSMFALRNRFAEDRFRAAVARGVEQYLSVGAGLDTFPWRHPGLACGMRIFLSDHPASLAWTQARFEDRGLFMPSNVTFVPADLQEHGLALSLEIAGLDNQTPTFVSMLGVMQYLTIQTIDVLLNVFASLPSTSELVFSFIVPDTELNGKELKDARVGAARSQEMGEPWLTRLSAEDFMSNVRRLGFSEVFHLSPELADHQYFAGRQDGLHASRREQLISAIK
jgi:methyltransferase (TIGR00027 family)